VGPLRPFAKRVADDEVGKPATFMSTGFRVIRRRSLRITTATDVPDRSRVERQPDSLEFGAVLRMTEGRVGNLPHTIRPFSPDVRHLPLASGTRGIVEMPGNSPASRVSLCLPTVQSAGLERRVLHEVSVCGVALQLRRPQQLWVECDDDRARRHQDRGERGRQQNPLRSQNPGCQRDREDVSSMCCPPNLSTCVEPW
jgi:hypothetical protein